MSRFKPIKQPLNRYPIVQAGQAAVGLPETALSRFRDLARHSASVRELAQLGLLGGELSTVRDLLAQAAAVDRGSLIPARTTPHGQWNLSNWDNAGHVGGRFPSRADLIRDPMNTEDTYILGPVLGNRSPGSRGDTFTRNYSPLPGDIRRHGWRDNLPPPRPSDNSDFVGAPSPAPPPTPLWETTRQNEFRRGLIAAYKREVIRADRVQGSPSPNPPPTRNETTGNTPKPPERQVVLGSPGPKPVKDVAPDAVSGGGWFPGQPGLTRSIPGLTWRTPARAPFYIRPANETDSGASSDGFATWMRRGLADEPPLGDGGPPLDPAEQRERWYGPRDERGGRRGW